MAKQYRNVTETHRVGDEYYFHGTLGQWQTKLEELINWHGHDAVMELDVEEGYYEDTTSISFRITVTRPETDDERDKRLNTAAKRRASAKKAAATRKLLRDEKDLEDYERLKKKFEVDE